MGKNAHGPQLTLTHSFGYGEANKVATGKT